MATPVILPQMSDTMTEGTLVRWLRAEGDGVSAGDPIAEIETDKAIMELESPVSGVLLRVLAAPDSVIPCGTSVAVIGAAGEVVSEEGGEPPTKDQRARASPVARKTAALRGIDVGQVSGTGPGGRVVLRDVVASTETRPKASQTDAAFPRQRTVMVSRLTASHRDAPTFTVTRTIRVGHAMALRKELSASGSFTGGIGITELCVAASARAMAKEPRLNGRYDGVGVVLQEAVNIGVAVGLEEYVAVPVVKRCNMLSLATLASEFKRVTTAAKNGSLLAEDAREGTFTVSNLGMWGVEQFNAVINPPEAAILAVGAVRKEPVVEGDCIGIREVMTVTLTVDHRVADGLHAARWLQVFAQLLEDPGQLV